MKKTENLKFFTGRLLTHSGRSFLEVGVTMEILLTTEVGRAQATTMWNGMISLLLHSSSIGAVKAVSFCIMSCALLCFHMYNYSSDLCSWKW